MLSTDFARDHKLCDYGMSQLKQNEGRELHEMWEDQNLQAGGTILFWIASRGRVNPQALVRCAAECTRTVLSFVDDGLDEAEQTIEKVVGWCDGRRSKDEVDAAARSALKHARQAKSAGNREAEHRAWSTLALLCRCVRNTASVSGTAGAVAATVEAGGGSAEDCQQRMADTIRSTFAWHEVDSAISAGQPSPRPRRLTADEVSEATRKITEDLDGVLTQWRTAAAEYRQLYSQLGTSPQRLQAFVRQGGLGEQNLKVFQEKLAEALAEETVGTPVSPAAAARRPRISV